MLTLDLESRLGNKTFILSMLGAVVLLIQQLGFKDLIPSNWLDIVNTVLSILVMLGIVVDTSTPGISDQVVSNVTVQAINQNNDQVKTDEATTSINNTISENSQDAAIDNLNASSKIVVDVPIE